MKRIAISCITQLLFSCFTLLSILSCSDKEIVKKSSEKKITSFGFALTTQLNASIDSVTNKITATLPIGTDLTKLAPVIEVSALSVVSPASGSVQDFSKPVSYTVTAEDGSTRIYTAQITALKSSEKKLLSFKFSELTPEVVGTITEGSQTFIEVSVPVGTSLKTLKPTIAVSPRATINPGSGILQDFSKAVSYTITAEDGSERKVSVTVIATDPPARITGISSTTLKPGSIITVQGVNFNPVANYNKLSIVEPDGAIADNLEIVDGTTTELKFKVSPNIDAMKYGGLNIWNGMSEKKSSYNNSALIVLPIEISPVVTGIDKTSITVGEKLTITGTNLSYPEADIWVQYFRSGVKINAQEAKINPDGSIYVNFRDTGKVGDKIKIKVQVGNVYSPLFAQEIERK